MSDDVYKKIFSKNLRYYMNLYEKSQQDLCRDLSLDKSTVSTWVNGSRMPRMDKVNLLAVYFHVLRSDLTEDKERSNSQEEIRRKEHIIFCYDLLNDDDKETVDRLFERAYQRYMAKNNEGAASA